MHYVGKFWLYKDTPLQELLDALDIKQFIQVSEAGDDYAGSFQNTLVKIHISWGTVQAINAVKLYTDNPAMENLLKLRMKPLLPQNEVTENDKCL